MEEEANNLEEFYRKKEEEKKRKQMMLILFIVIPLLFGGAAYGLYTVYTKLNETYKYHNRTYKYVTTVLYSSEFLEAIKGYCRYKQIPYGRIIGSTNERIRKQNDVFISGLKIELKGKNKDYIKGEDAHYKILSPKNVLSAIDLYYKNKDYKFNKILRNLSREYNGFNFDYKPLVIQIGIPVTE